jgi:hypothetical protein
MPKPQLSTASLPVAGISVISSGNVAHNPHMGITVQRGGCMISRPRCLHQWACREILPSSYVGVSRRRCPVLLYIRALAQIGQELRWILLQRGIFNLCCLVLSLQYSVADAQRLLVCGSEFRRDRSVRLFSR